MTHDPQKAPGVHSGRFAVSPRFSPVERFWLDDRALASGSIAGFAAGHEPATPSALKLTIDGAVFAVTKACEFSAPALAAGVQNGWAGFSIRGLATVLALRTRMDLRCAMSDRLLVTLTEADLPGDAPPRRKTYVNVSALRAASRARFGCSELTQALPLGEHYRNVRGDTRFIEASYLWLQRRAPSAAETSSFMDGLGPAWGAMDAWTRFADSEEFRAGPGFPLLGPYEPGFPFTI